MDNPIPNPTPAPAAPPSAAPPAPPAVTMPVLYRSATVLNREVHAGLRLARQSDFRFAQGTNSVPALLSEFEALAAYCPIGFGRDADGRFFPVAVLGFADGENLFVGQGGQWLAPYVPAWIRRYPFMLAATTRPGETGYLLLADLEAPHFAAADGTPLFAGEGPDAIMGQAIDFCLRVEQELAATRAFAAALAEANVLVEARDGDARAAVSFWTVDPDRVADLPAETLVAWRSSGALRGALRVVASNRRWRGLAALRV